jgi:hypothetical protein
VIIYFRIILNLKYIKQRALYFEEDIDLKSKWILLIRAHNRINSMNLKNNQARISNL